MEEGMNGPKGDKTGEKVNNDTGRERREEQRQQGSRER